MFFPTNFIHKLRLIIEHSFQITKQGLKANKYKMFSQHTRDIHVIIMYID